jgi:hypothetical protein
MPERALGKPPGFSYETTITARLEVVSMRPAAWRRLVARMVLVAFTTSFVACGGSPGEQPGTSAATVAPATAAPAPAFPPPTAPPVTLPAQPPEQLGKQDLRELVAPVALYPDVVLASLLPATTYPEQIRDAAAYVGQAQQVERIPEERGWDGSVVGLLQFPDVLRWLDQNPGWTDEMGQAVTYQQGDVLDAIQDYRRAVMDAGNLKSNQYQNVRAAPEQDIRIEPARPEVVYVPSYDPVVATQPQPPQQSPGINPWIIFGGGAVVGALGAWALYSIFDDDDDDDDEVHHHYHGGGGRRRIRGYDNYYYARGRRPRPVEWTPRQRARARARADEWKRPRRLEHVSPAARPANRTALRPPRTRAPEAVATPGDPRQERRQQKQTRQQERQLQRRHDRQERQERQQSQRQRQQRQTQRQQRPDRPGQPQRREQRQERSHQEQPRQEEQRRQRQERQREQQEMRRERREQKAERRQDDGQGKKKKKQAQQDQTR